MKLPGPDHPISIEAARDRVTVSFDGVTIAETDAALELREARYAPVFYIPRADVRADLLHRTTHRTTCPYKGEAGYFTVKAAGHSLENAVWTYEAPFPAVAPIAGHLAFYPDKVTIVRHAPRG